MGVRKTLEDIIDRVTIHPKAVGLASAPVTFFSVYALLNSSVSSVRGTLLAPTLSVLASLASYYKITDYFNQRKVRNELGIEEREFERLDENVVSAVPEKKGNLVQRVWNSFLLHPKSYAVALGVAFTTYTGVKVGILHYALEHIANGTFGRFLLNATAYNAGFLAISSYISYLALRCLQPVASTYDAPTFFRLFPALFASNKIKIRLLSEQIKKKPSRFLKLTLAHNLLKQNEIDAACQQLKETLSAPNEPFFKTRKLSHTVKSVFAETYQAFAKKETDIQAGISLAWILNDIGHHETADNVLCRLTKAANSAEASALAAMWLDAFGRKESAEGYWQDSALRLVSDDSAVVLPVGEGVNHVYRIGGKFMRDLIIIKEQPLSAMEDERRVLAYAASIPKETKYTQPDELAAFTYQKGSAKHALVLRLMTGKTLLEKARDGTASYDDLLTVTDYASLLHRNLPLSLSSAGKVNLKHKLEAIVSNPYFGIGEDLQKSIMRNAEFMAEDLNGYEVISLDNHAGNWHFGEDKRTSKLDFTSAKDSLFRDLAKLFAHPELPIKDDHVCSLQREAFNRYAGTSFMPVGENDFRKLHLQGILFQELSFASAWSVPEMSHMRAKRGSVIEGAFPIFGMIKQNHSAHYSLNKSSYDALKNDFNILREFMAVK